MQRDRALLEELSEPILHLYDWANEALTYGHFVKIGEHVAEGLDMARRPTGGGVVFHTCDLAFSLLIPVGHAGYFSDTLKNYRWVNERVAQAIRCFSNISPELIDGDFEGPRHFCMARPTIYDLVVDGKKVGGAAQRRTKKGYLHQGTISLKMPEERHLALLKNEAVAEAMRERSYPLAGEMEIGEARRRLRDCLKDVILLTC